MRMSPKRRLSTLARGQARRRDFRMRSLQTGWCEPLCHSAPPGTPQATGSGDE